MSEFLHDDFIDDGEFEGDARILPKSLQQFLLNRFFEIVGIFILLAVVFSTIAIATWSSTDPSLNHATSDLVQNSLGYTGAYTSDFLIQTFGLAVIALFIPILLMAVNLIRHRVIKRPVLRSIAWVFSSFFIAGALSSLPVLASWPLKTGLGGLSGDVTISVLADLFGSSLQLAAHIAAGMLLAILGVALSLYACGLRFKEMLATLTFMNETSIDTGAQMVKNAKDTTSLLGRKSMSLASHIANLKSQKKDPFQDTKKPWKTPDNHAPLEYEDLTNKNNIDADRNENAMKNAPEFISRNNADQNGERNTAYNPLKVKTNQFISKIISGLSGIKAEPEPMNAGQHIDPSFNPHAFEPIGQQAAPSPQAEAHIPNLNQDVQTHYQQQQADPYQITPVNVAPQMQAAPIVHAPNQAVHQETVGSAEMGDFYDGPNSYEDYWTDSVAIAEPLMQQPMMHEPILQQPMMQAAAAQVPDIHPFAPQAAPQMQYQAAPVQAAAPQTTHFDQVPTFDEYPAYDQAPQAQMFEAPIQAAPLQAAPAPQPMAAAPIAPHVPVAPIAAVPIAAPIMPAAPIAPAPAIDIEPAENASNINQTPFDLSAPQVNVRQGRTVSEAATGFNHGPSANGEFVLPAIDLLSMPIPDEAANKVSEKILAANARILENVLAEFRISGEIMNVRPGPVVTLYELEPAPGVKSARVIGLADDIARSMSAISARIAVIPGRNIIGIELPNEHRDTVYLNEIIASEEFAGDKLKLPMALGKSIDGSPVIADLARMPHLLIAGTTGSGKSVGINSMILSILYKMSPDKCKLIMVDPKMLELSVYDGIPHLLTPVVTDPKKAVVALKWSVREMENRYKKMSKLGVRNIEGYNQRIKAAEDKGEPLMRTVQTGFDHETGKPVYEHEALDYKEMPFIVIVIDEMADLMMVAGKEIEGVIQRLAQMARAAGIHMITATQRPSVDVITGSIKANFPTRISFQVTSKIDSRTILNEMGAEQLLGQGDMLHMAGGGRINRVHGAFVADAEVESVVNHLKRQGVPQYIDDITTDVEEEAEVAAPDGGPAPTTDENGDALDLYDQAVAIVARDKKASTSYIQRKLSIGYNRAATIIERMEEEGVVGPANHAGKREILVGDHSDF